MLDPWIIERIRRREEAERRDERPQLEVPTPDERYHPQVEEESRRPDDEPKDRGVVIIDFAL